MSIPFILKETPAVGRKRELRLALTKICVWSAVVVVAGLATAARAGEPLHVKIDAVLAKAHPIGQAPFANDADFVRRTYLTLHGTIPTAAQARAFFADSASDKRAKLVDALLADPQFAHWLAVRLDVMLMERRAEKYTKEAPWRDWLEGSIAANKPWDVLVGETLGADGGDEKTRHLTRWVLEREADPFALTKDAGRLFLGRDITCSQCHDHPRIDDYLQRDYAGLEAFFSRTSLLRAAATKSAMIAEQASGETTYLSVFTKVGGTTKPRLPGEMELPDLSGEWIVPPNAKDKTVRPIPKYSRRAMLAKVFGNGHHPAFRRNIANRLWAIVFGRGIVEPLDLLHSANPPENPELLDLLADQMAAMKFDMRGFIRELAQTDAFQRALDVPESPPAVDKSVAEKLPALEKDAHSLADAATSAEEEFRAAQKAIVAVQRAAPALQAEQAKLGALASAKQAADEASAQLKVAEDAVAAKCDALKELTAVAAKANQDDGTADDTLKNAAISLKLQSKVDAAAKALQAAEQEMAAKKADSKVKALRLAAAEKDGLAAKTKVESVSKEIEAKQAALDTAGTHKVEARIKAAQAAHLAAEIKGVLAWSSAPADRQAQNAVGIMWGKSFAAMELLPLTPEQLCWSTMQATGQMDAARTAATTEWDAKNKPTAADKADPAKAAVRAAGIRKLLSDRLHSEEIVFVRFFGGAPGQPQTDFFATPEQALYFENGGVIHQWAALLANRAAALPDAKAMAEEIYLSTLTRMPERSEVADLTTMLAAHPVAKKGEVLGDLAWALLTSTEFRFVH